MIASELAAMFVRRLFSAGDYEIRSAFGLRSLIVLMMALVGLACSAETVRAFSIRSP
jgi:hypothetical protein